MEPTSICSNGGIGYQEPNNVECHLADIDDDDDTATTLLRRLSTLSSVSASANDNDRAISALEVLCSDSGNDDDSEDGCGHDHKYKLYNELPYI